MTVFLGLVGSPLWKPEALSWYGLLPLPLPLPTPQNPRKREKGSSPFSYSCLLLCPDDLLRNKDKQTRSLLTRNGMTAPALPLLAVCGVFKVLSRSETLNSAWGTRSPLITLKPHVANCPNYSRAVPHRPPAGQAGRRSARAHGARRVDPSSARRSGGRVGGPSRAHRQRLPGPEPGRSSHTSGAPAVPVEWDRSTSESLSLPTPYRALPALGRRGSPGHQAPARPAPPLPAQLLGAAASVPPFYVFIKSPRFLTCLSHSSPVPAPCTFLGAETGPVPLSLPGPTAWSGGRRAFTVLNK
ncbi:uncharacterized protein LOC132221120 [Myotis daubentonii]|uniref:uncharacterized protein LOC132221120 n=1 Tax=Myotis daubentonii TaxID=98922 RepID=UPI002872DA85|nr:uncharacterized protein LOC132221120 [Myotis daubentonii]